MSQIDYERQYWELLDRCEVYEGALLDVLNALCLKLQGEVGAPTRERLEEFLGLRISERVWKNFASWANF